MAVIVLNRGVLPLTLVPPVLFLIFFCDDSPQFMHARGNSEEAAVALKKIANRNGNGHVSKLDIVKMLKRVDSDVSRKNASNCPEKDSISSVKDSENITLYDLFTYSSEMRWMAFKVLFLWVAVDIVYYGLYLKIQEVNVACQYIFEYISHARVFHCHPQN